jgi:5'-nucleotidase (lipoprotein e(P4) family)
MKLFKALVCVATLSLAGCLNIDAAFDWNLPGPDNQIKSDDRLYATYWTQQSAEYRGSAKMAYAIARLRLDQALADKTWTAAAEQTAGFQDLPPAIILDVDETVLDNSRFNGALIKGNALYHSSLWDKFVNDAVSPAIPGALEFTNYAADNGVTVFYVTNRRAHLEEATYENLESEGFPLQEGTDTLLLKNEQEGWGSEKGSRRSYIAKNYRILLLIGDNLGDFTDGILTAPEQRRMIVEKNNDHFGRDWIILPNPIYGSWENSAIGFQFTRSAKERRQSIGEQLEDWKPEP